jgi:hypothetical protein
MLKLVSVHVTTDLCFVCKCNKKESDFNLMVLNYLLINCVSPFHAYFIAKSKSLSVDWYIYVPMNVCSKSVSQSVTCLRILNMHKERGVQFVLYLQMHGRCDTETVEWNFLLLLLLFW